MQDEKSLLYEPALSKLMTAANTKLDKERDGSLIKKPRLGGGGGGGGGGTQPFSNACQEDAEGSAAAGA